jgi:Lrp/AsnC family transcriptional regulator, leucine-responsive regulatory protein
MGRLDDVDMKILSALRADASVSIPKLSKDLGVNLSVAYSKIKRMRRLGLIMGFTVMVDEEKLGLQAVGVLGLTFDPKSRESAVKALETADGVRMVLETTGRFDALVELRASSVAELHRKAQEEIGGIPGVQRVETFVEVSRKFPSFEFRLAK